MFKAIDNTANSKNILWTFALIVLWALVQLTLFFYKGVHTSADSPLYLDAARTILNGNFPEGRVIWYLGYSLFLSAIFFLGGNLTTVVILQCAFSGLAALAVYNAAFRLSSSRAVAILSVFLYIGWIKIHEWNMFIYTDSLFTSFSIISFALLVAFKKMWHYSVAILLIALTFFIRPTGFGFLLAAMGFFLQLSYTKMPQRNFLFALSVLFVLFIVGLNFILNEFIWYFIDGYSKGEIIYPNINLGVQVPSDLFLPPVDQAPIIRLLSFGWHNPIFFIKVTFIKAFLFLGNVKPYFSWQHNLAIVIFLYPIYGFATYGFSKIQWGGEKVFILCFILSQIATVALFSENWDGRFLVPILPFIFILAAVGIVSTFYRFRKSQFIAIRD